MSNVIKFTNSTRLSEQLSSERVVSFLHDHAALLDSNPFVVDHKSIARPQHASQEDADCDWYSVTESLAYLPRALCSFSSTCSFNDTPTGVVRQFYAPLGVEGKSTWSLDRLGDDAEPQDRTDGSKHAATLRLREDVELHASFLFQAFIQRSLGNCHKEVVKAMESKS